MSRPHPSPRPRPVPAIASAIASAIVPDFAPAPTLVRNDPVTSATENARAALHRLSQPGLPPTPENFQRFYAEAAGGDELPAQGRPVGGTLAKTSGEARELMQAVRRFAEQLSQATGSLAEHIEQRNAELKVSMDSMDTLPWRETGAAAGVLAAVDHAVHHLDHTHHGRSLARRIATDPGRDRTAQARTAAEQGVDAAGSLDRHAEPARHGCGAAARSRPRSAQRQRTVLVDDRHRPFKILNDSHGHHAGDRALVHLAEITRSVLRETDIVVRYGGEEFLMSFPETHLNGARFVVDRLKLVVQKTPLIYEGRKISLNFSAGIAQLQPDENGSPLVLRAERAVLSAKKQGRNCIVVAEERPVSPRSALWKRCSRSLSTNRQSYTICKLCGGSRTIDHQHQQGSLQVDQTMVAPPL